MDPCDSFSDSKLSSLSLLDMCTGVRTTTEFADVFIPHFPLAFF